MMAVEIPERAGSLIDFCKLLDNRNLTEFSYRCQIQRMLRSL